MLKRLIKDRFLVIYVLSVSLIVRLINLNQSFWLDESITATVVEKFSFSEIVTKYIVSDTHPPLYYLVVKLWTLVFGTSEISLRLPSVIFGVITVFAVYKIVEIYDKKIALFSSILMALAPLHVYYSQEARMYSFTTLLVCITFYMFIKKRWILFSFAILLLGLTDYLPLVILVPLWVYTFFKFNQKDLKRFIFSHLPTGLYILYWYPTFLIQSKSTTKYLSTFPQWKEVLGSASIRDLGLVWVKFMEGRISLDNKVVYYSILTLATFIFSYVIYGGLKFFKKFQLIWFWFVIPIAISFIGALFVPGFSYFRLIFTLPAFYILISVGISTFGKKETFFTLVLLLNSLFLSVYLFNSKYWREDWKTAVPFIEGRLKGGEVVAVSYGQPFTPYIWYSKQKDRIYTFSDIKYENLKGLYTLDYLMDLTDKDRENYQKLKTLGFIQSKVYNFRGIGQIRYWQRSI